MSDIKGHAGAGARDSKWDLGIKEIDTTKMGFQLAGCLYFAVGKNVGEKLIGIKIM